EVGEVGPDARDVAVHLRALHDRRVADRVLARVHVERADPVLDALRSAAERLHGERLALGRGHGGRSPRCQNGEHHDERASCASDPGRHLEKPSYALASASASASSWRSDLISSRSLAAYSKRRSSAAASISSSSSTIVLRSSSADMPSVSRRLRPRPVGTFDSVIRKSEMSEIPFWIVSGVIPCSSLY